MPIKRHPEQSPAAFTGKYHVVNTNTWLSVESERTLDLAERACKIFNDHNEKNGFRDRYRVEIEEEAQS